MLRIGPIWGVFAPLREFVRDLMNLTLSALARRFSDPLVGKGSSGISSKRPPEGFGEIEGSMAVTSSAAEVDVVAGVMLVVEVLSASVGPLINRGSLVCTGSITGEAVVAGLEAVIFSAVGGRLVG